MVYGSEYGVHLRVCTSMCFFVSTITKRKRARALVNYCHNMASRYGPVISVNRPVRTRMPGGVGRGREKLPLTRSPTVNVFFKCLIILRFKTTAKIESVSFFPFG